MTRPRETAAWLAEIEDKGMRCGRGEATLCWVCVSNQAVAGSCFAGGHGSCLRPAQTHPPGSKVDRGQSTAVVSSVGAGGWVTGKFPSCPAFHAVDIDGQEAERTSREAHRRDHPLFPTSPRLESSVQA